MRLTGLLLAATIVALAVAGVGSAAPALAKPSVLCKVNEDPCPEEDIYSLPANFGGGQGGTSVEVALPEVTISCPIGKLFMVLNETEGPLVGEVTRWKPVACEPEPCYLEALETGYSAELEATGGGDGVLTVVASNFLADCYPPICLYSTTPIEFTFEGGSYLESSPPHMSTETAMGLEGGFGACGNPAPLRAGYSVFEPGPSLYVSHR